MGLLYLIWASAFALGCAAVLVCLLLVLRRYLAEKRAVQRTRDRKKVQQKLFLLISMRSGLFDTSLQKSSLFDEKERRHVVALCLRLCQIIKGHEEERLIRILLSMGFDQRCLRDLKKGSEDARHAAAIALQYFHDEESRRALLKALHDPAAEVCFAAAKSLLLRDELPEVSQLLDIFASQDFLHSYECNNLFRHLAMRKPEQLVAAAAGNDLPVDLKKVLAYAMGYAANYTVLRALLKFADDREAAVRLAALESLRRLEHPDAEPVILAALEDDNWEVQNAAALAAGEIGLQKALRDLDALLLSPNWLLSFNAAQSLWQLGQQGRDLLLTRSRFINMAGRMSALVLDEQLGNAASNLTVRTDEL